MTRLVLALIVTVTGMWAMSAPADAFDGLFGRRARSNIDIDLFDNFGNQVADIDLFNRGHFFNRGSRVNIDLFQNRGFNGFNRSRSFNFNGFNRGFSRPRIFVDQCGRAFILR